MEAVLRSECQHIRADAPEWFSGLRKRKAGFSGTSSGVGCIVGSCVAAGRVVQRVVKVISFLASKGKLSNSCFLADARSHPQGKNSGRWGWRASSPTEHCCKGRSSSHSRCSRTCRAWALWPPQYSPLTEFVQLAVCVPCAGVPWHCSYPCAVAVGSVNVHFLLIFCSFSSKGEHSSRGAGSTSLGVSTGPVLSLHLLQALNPCFYKILWESGGVLCENKHL